MYRLRAVCGVSDSCSSYFSCATGVAVAVSESRCCYCCVLYVHRRRSSERTGRIIALLRLPMSDDNGVAPGYLFLWVIMVVCMPTQQLQQWYEYYNNSTAAALLQAIDVDMIHAHVYLKKKKK